MGDRHREPDICCPLHPAFPLALPLHCSLNYFHSGQLLLFSLQWRQFCSDGVVRFTKYSEGLFLQGLQKACFICLVPFILCCPWLCWTPNCYPALSAQISAEDLEATQSKPTCDTQSENCYSPAYTNEQQLKRIPHAHAHTLRAARRCHRHTLWKSFVWRRRRVTRVWTRRGCTSHMPAFGGCQLLVVTLTNTQRGPLGAQWAVRPISAPPPHAESTWTHCKAPSLRKSQFQPAGRGLAAFSTACPCRRITCFYTGKHDSPTHTARAVQRPCTQCCAFLSYTHPSSSLRAQKRVKK